MDISTFDMRLCSREFIVDFIKIYRKHACLWKRKDPAYRNKRKRNAAYGELVQFCRQIIPQADVHFVKAKLGGMRGTFRRELRKVLDATERYEPAVWYYELMLFLVEQDDEDEDEEQPSMSDAERDTSEGLSRTQEFLNKSDSKELYENVKNVDTTVSPGYSDMRLCSKNFLTVFIKIYRKNVCLWDEKDPSYRNKQRRNVAYGELVELCKKLIPQADVHFVKSKVQCLRSGFQRELRKVRESKGSYEPSLWYFKSMLFLVEDGDKDGCNEDQPSSPDVEREEGVLEYSNDNSMSILQQCPDDLEKKCANVEDFDISSLLDTSDMLLNSKSFVADFIAIYRKNICLWKKKDPSYRCGKKRDAAYDELLKLCKTFQPKTDIHFVKTKVKFDSLMLKYSPRDFRCTLYWAGPINIQRLRTMFQRELKKVYESNGCYEPTLWYYELMLFLVERDDEVEHDGEQPSSTDTEQEESFEVKCGLLRRYSIDMDNSETYVKDANAPSTGSTDKRFFSREFITEFIAIYRRNVCLWREKDPLFRNKRKRHAGYDELVELCRRFNPNTDVHFVRSKIQSLRATFRRELRKVRESNGSYEPTLWYYQPMLFLIEQDEDDHNEDSPSSDIDQETEKSLDFSDDTSLLDLQKSIDLNKSRTKRLRRKIKTIDTKTVSSSNSDPRFCSKSFITDFIKIFRKNVCLWKEKHPSFRNKRKKQAAYSELVRYSKKFNPEADEYFVRSKVASLRSSFRRELRKVNESDRCYAPTLWYYEPMLFLVEEDDKGADDEDAVMQPSSPEDTHPYAAKEEEEIDEHSDDYSNLEPQQFVDVGEPRRLFDEYSDDCRDVEYKALGMNIVSKLRRMNSVQAVFAEALINKILCRGLLKTLTKNTDV